MIDMSKKAITITTLRQWAIDELKNGNKTKASKTNRAMERTRGRGGS